MLKPDTTYEWQIRAFCNAEGTVWSPFTEIHSFKTKSVSVRISGNRNICNGQTSTITATGGKYYTWSSGETTAEILKSPTTTTTYTVTTSINGMSTTDQIIVNVQSAIDINVGLDTTICSGSEILLVSTGADNYEWSIGSMRDSVKVKPTQTTVYKVTGIKGVCWGEDSVKVIVNVSPFTNAGADKTICYGDSVTLLATGGTVFSWDNGSSMHYIEDKPLTTSTYTVTSYIGSCEATDMVVVVVRPVNLELGSDVNACSGQNVTLTVTGSYAYQWNTGSRNQIINVIPIATTKYIVTGYSAEGCTAIDSVTVNISNNLNVYIGNDTTICLGYKIGLKAMPDSGTSYRWNTGSLRQSITMTPKTTTTYIVTVKKDGCSGSNMIVINTVACKDIFEDKNEVSINKDEDDFVSVYPNPVNNNYIKVTIDKPSLYQKIEIFNVVGTKVFETNEINEVNTISIDYLINAVYFVKVKGNFDIKTFKIIKNNH